MKVNADVTIEYDAKDIENMGLAIDEAVGHQAIRDVTDAIKKSEAFRDLKTQVYHACLDKLRDEVRKEFVDKIKGE
jgi:hypothetical protein